MRYNPFKDYDKHGWIKLPWLFYLALAYLLKGYVIWVVSLSYRENPAALLEIFYPNRHDFYQALLVAIPAIVCLGVITFRRLSLSITAWLWHHIRWLLSCCALIQIINLFWLGHISWQYAKHISSHYWPFVDLCVLTMVMFYLMFNRRVKDLNHERIIIEETQKKRTK